MCQFQNKYDLFNNLETIVCICPNSNNFFTDVNECIEGACQGGRCYNTQGSFTCTCPTGFDLSSDGRSCIGKKVCLLELEEKSIPALEFIIFLLHFCIITILINILGLHQDSSIGPLEYNSQPLLSSVRLINALPNFLYDRS